MEITYYAPITLLLRTYYPITHLLPYYVPITHLLRAYYGPITRLLPYYAPVTHLLRTCYGGYAGVTQIFFSLRRYLLIRRRAMKRKIYIALHWSS